MNQLTTTNQFKLEETLMQKVFEASGYQFTIITPNGGEPHFIAKEVAEGLGYARNDYLTEKLKNNGFTLLKLTKENGLTLLKRVSSISKNTRNLTLIPSGVLQEYLVQHATRPKAKELGHKLYEILSKSYTVQPELYDGKKLEDHPFFLTIHSEVEAEGLRYTKTYNLTQHMDDVIKLTKRNGLGFLIEILDACSKKGKAETIWDGKNLDKINQLSLIPESALLKYTLKSATRPKAKVVSEKLYQALIKGKVIFSIEDELDEFDDKDRMLKKLAKTHPEVLQSSKDINALFHSFIEFDPGYFNWSPPFKKEPVYG